MDKASAGLLVYWDRFEVGKPFFRMGIRYLEIRRLLQGLGMLCGHAWFPVLLALMELGREVSDMEILQCWR